MKHLIIKAKPYIISFIPLFLKKVIFIGVSFFQLYIMTHYLSFEKYGKFQFVLTILASIFFSCREVILPTTKWEQKEEQYYFAFLTYKIKFSLFGSIVLFAISVYHFHDKDLFYGLLICSFVFPLFYNLDSYFVLLNGQERFYKSVFALDGIVNFHV